MRTEWRATGGSGNCSWCPCQEGSLDSYGETEAGGSREPRQRWALQGVWGGGETQPGPEPGALGAQVMGVGREGRPAHRCRWPVSAHYVPGA